MVDDVEKANPYASPRNPDATHQNCYLPFDENCNLVVLALRYHK
jgi:hypothetical protein